jgi:Zn-dependent protease
LDTSRILNILASFLAAAIILSFHEFAHAYAAVKNGDMTPKIYHRYTLNPLAHFDILGLLMFTFVGFGWAKPVPINPSNFHNYRKGLFWTAIAGVLTNYILAFLSYPILILAYNYLPDFLLFDDLIILFLSYCFSFNLVFCVFNLLPLYPLDGFRVMEAFNRKRGKIFTFLNNYGYYILIGLVAFGYIVRLMNLYQFDFLSIILSFATDIFGWPIIWLWGLIF